MQPMFSEFSYGYALMEELASGKLAPLLGAPVFPSLYREGQSGGGYDVQLPLQGAPFFLQFKLSHYLWRSNAPEWNLFGGHYYRMYLRPLRHSAQHKLLIALNTKEEVYYVTPEFHTAWELNEAYTSKTVVESSVFFSPLVIGSLPDDDVHYVVFNRSNSVAYLCSEEYIKLERFYGGKVFWESQVSRTRRRKTEINERFFEAISDQIVDLLHKQISTFDQLELLQSEMRRKRETLKEKAQFVAYLARAYSDAELFIIAEQDDVS